MLVLIVLIVIVCLFFCGPAISANDWTTATGFETKDFSYEYYQDGNNQFKFTKSGSALRLDNYEVVVSYLLDESEFKKITYQNNIIVSEEKSTNEEYNEILIKYVRNILFDNERDYYSYTYNNECFYLNYNRYVTTTEGCYLSENKTIVSFDNKIVKSIQKTYLNKKNNKLKTITYVF